jgi:hypothetical protein|tara:strand:- start:3913 stop:4074 length:162 start_codon:yes stop_codon:yes gene_type:complete
MQIQLWYSKEISQWRWSLTPEDNLSNQHTGGQKNLRDAMNDVATTVEYLLDED